MRPSWSTIGRDAPFSRRTDASPLTATTSTSPHALACVSVSTWPACSRSKQPLVKTTVFPSRRSRSSRSVSASVERIFRRESGRGMAESESGLFPGGTRVRFALSILRQAQDIVGSRRRTLNELRGAKRTLENHCLYRPRPSMFRHPSTYSASPFDNISGPSTPRVR